MRRTSRSPVASVLPVHPGRLERQLAIVEEVRAEHPEGLPRFHAHMRLQQEGLAKPTDILLGGANRVGAVVPIIDWRTAPLAHVFFAFEEGEEYEVELADRTMSGRLLEKNLLTFDKDRLVRVDHAAGSFVRAKDGTWETRAERPFPALPARPASTRGPYRSPLEVQLDPAQQAIVDLPSSLPVLILGEAGFGKTTVALHRLIKLQREGGPDFRAAVIVPTAGLRILTEMMLERRGVQNVEVWVYDQWAERVARGAFPDLPARIGMSQHAGVMRLKRHGALRPVLAEYVKEKPIAPEIGKKRKSTKSLARRGDLELVFGDRKWLRKVVAGSNGAIREGVIEEIAEYTRIQFSEAAEKAYKHVDKERLQTADGLAIDEGTPMEMADSVDAEDFAVLFEIDRLRAEATGAKPATTPRYDVVVVDEAQELSPLELALLSRAVSARGTLIVAGDAAQQVDVTSDFAGWPQAMKDLGAEEHQRAVLEVNYRCPPDVTALARHVVDPASPLPESEPAILRVAHPSNVHLSHWLLQELITLQSDDPTASIAIVARSSDAARSIIRTLRHALDVQLALGGSFEFLPGIVVTSVQEVKGLEFDHVVVPDADAGTYPDTPHARRTLYVAVTRATHRLVLASAGEWTPLLR